MMLVVVVLLPLGTSIGYAVGILGFIPADTALLIGFAVPEHRELKPEAT